MRLLYEAKHFERCEKLGDQRYLWLDDLGAAPLHEATPDEEGFLFSLDAGTDEYAEMLCPYANIQERPKCGQRLMTWLES